MSKDRSYEQYSMSLREYLVDHDQRLSSDNLKVLGAMLQEELNRQHTDAFNVIRLIERIQDGLYRQHPGFDAGSGKTVDDYFEMMPERIGIPKQTVSYLRIDSCIFWYSTSAQRPAAVREVWPDALSLIVLPVLVSTKRT